MSTSNERAQALAELKPPASTERIVRFLQELTRSGAPFVDQIEAPIGSIGLSALAFSKRISRDLDVLRPTDATRAAMDMYSVRANDLRDFTHWIYKYELLRNSADSPVEPRSVVLEPGPREHDIVFREVTRVIVEKVPEVRYERLPGDPRRRNEDRRIADRVAQPHRDSTPPAEVDAMKAGLAKANRGVWTSNLAAAGMLAGIHMGMASAGVAPGTLGPATAFLSAAGVSGGGMFGTFNPSLDAPGMPRWQQAAQDPKQGGPVLKEKVREFHFWQQGRVRDLQTTNVKEIAEDPIAQAAMRPQFAAGFAPMLLGALRPGLGGFTPEGHGTGASPAPSAIQFDSFQSPHQSMGVGRPVGLDLGQTTPQPLGMGRPIGLALRQDPLSPEFAPLPPQPGAFSLPDQAGMVTVLAPPLRVASPESEAGGSAVAFEWSQLGRSAGRLDETTWAQLGAVLPPGSQVIYPAVPQPGLGVNLALSPSLISSLASRAYGVDLPASEASSVSTRGAISSGSGQSVMPVMADIVPHRRPMGDAGSVLGDRNPSAGQAIQSAGSGQAGRGAALDFLGVPVRLAPSLAAHSELRSEQNVQEGMRSITGTQAIRPQAFGMLRQSLFPSMQSVTAEPDRAAWRRAAPSFGLRSADPQAVIAPDARVKPPKPSESLPQMQVASPPAPKPIGGGVPPMVQNLLNRTPIVPIQPIAPSVGSPSLGAMPPASVPSVPSPGGLRSIPPTSPMAMSAIAPRSLNLPPPPVAPIGMQALPPFSQRHVAPATTVAMMSIPSSSDGPQPLPGKTLTPSPEPSFTDRGGSSGDSPEIIHNMGFPRSAMPEITVMAPQTGVRGAGPQVQVGPGSEHLSFATPPASSGVHENLPGGMVARPSTLEGSPITHARPIAPRTPSSIPSAFSPMGRSLGHSHSMPTMRLPSFMSPILPMSVSPVAAPLNFSAPELVHAPSQAARSSSSTSPVAIQTALNGVDGGGGRSGVVYDQIETQVQNNESESDRVQQVAVEVWSILKRRLAVENTRHGRSI